MTGIDRVSLSRSFCESKSLRSSTKGGSKNRPNGEAAEPRQHPFLMILWGLQNGFVVASLAYEHLRNWVQSIQVIIVWNIIKSSTHTFQMCWWLQTCPYCCRYSLVYVKLFLWNVSMPILAYPSNNNQVPKCSQRVSLLTLCRILHGVASGCGDGTALSPTAIIQHHPNCRLFVTADIQFFGDSPGDVKLSTDSFRMFAELSSVLPSTIQMHGF